MKLGIQKQSLLYKAAVIFFFLVSLGGGVFAQQPGSLDLTFNPNGLGPSGEVRKILVQPDGKIIIVGGFAHYNNILRPGIVRLDANGEIDPNFISGTGTETFGGIFDAALLPDGKIILVGSFNSFNGVTTKKIARLNADGTLDLSFNSFQGADGSIKSVAIQPDGKIIVAGSFHNYNGIAKPLVARLHQTGELDNTFSIGSSNLNGHAYSCAIQADAKLLLGGSFYFTAGNYQRQNLVRFNVDGSADTLFYPGGGVNSDGVNCITLQADNKILIGGEFYTVNQDERINIARLNPDGMVDLDFTTGWNLIGPVNSIISLPGGKVFAGGSFEIANLTKGIVQLNSDGSQDTSFTAGSGFDHPNLFVFSTALQVDGKILAGGAFSSYNSNPVFNLARINNSLITATSEQIFETALLYPNPAKQQVQVRLGGDETSATLQLYSATGHQVLEQQVRSQSMVSLQGLPQGLYLYRVLAGEQVVNGKLVVE